VNEIRNSCDPGLRDDLIGAHNCDSHAEQLPKGYAWAIVYLTIIVGSLLIVALAISIRNSFRDHEDKPSNPVTSNTKQTVNQSVNPQQHVYISKEMFQQDARDKRSDPPAPKPRPKPNIQFVETKAITAHAGTDDGQIHESPQALGEFQISVLCFRNEPVVGRRVQEPSVKAHIIYKGKDGEEITDAPRAVWLGHYGEEIVFETGKKRCLIVFLLSSQDTLKKLWKESYTTSESWMAGGPLFRIRDEGIRGEIASIEVSLLAGDACLLLRILLCSP
jgi:hypothetical protein